MSIYKVNTNLKHNGTDFAQGSFVDEYTFGEELTASFVADNVLVHVEGAETIDEAAEIVENKEEDSAPIEPKDTWGPSPEVTDDEDDSLAAGNASANNELENTDADTGETTVPAEVTTSTETDTTPKEEVVDEDDGSNL